MNSKIFGIGLIVCFLSLSSCGGSSEKKPGASSITLTGKAFYEDRVFDKNGFTGKTTQKPIRNAIVEVVTNTGSKVIGTGTTDSLGAFSLVVDNSANQAGLYVRIVSKTDSTQNTKVEILNNDAAKAVLSVRSSLIDDSTSDTLSVQQDIIATVSSGGGAFNLLDVLSDASEFVQNNVDCATLSGCIPPLVTVFWEPGSDDGTFYDDTAVAIHVLGGGTADGDTDEYDDAVVIHEYGHFILNRLSKDNSPGGEHFLSENDQDIRLSWSEGWANFFALAVLGSPVYVDTVPGGTLISFNLEDYSSSQLQSLDSVAIYTTNELAVAGVLWDALDPVDNAPPESDPLALTFGDIWQTILNFIPSEPTTMETFWLQFESGLPASAVDFQTIMKDRKIELFADNGDTVGEILLQTGGMQHHTLYRNGMDPTQDMDVIPFKVKNNMTYTVKTFGLTNGADTILTIKDGMTSLSSNDNPNDVMFSSTCAVNPGTGISNCPKNGLLNLSSSLTFTWTQSDTTLTAEVGRSPGAPPSAGVFGSYEISLTSP